MNEKRTKLIRGARLLDATTWNGEHRDILIKNGKIAEIGSFETGLSDDIEVIDANDNLIHPGLVNGHTHGHGSFAKGTGDLWSLELLLAAGPWISGNRAPEDRYLAALLNAAEMALKGTTACYDLFFELPTPTPDGIMQAAKAYNDVGVRVTMAPMLADRSLYESVSGLRDYLSVDLRSRTDKFRPLPFEQTMTDVRQLVSDWNLDSDFAKLALAPTIPAHCTDEFLHAIRELTDDRGLSVHSHVSESKVQLLSTEREFGSSVVARLDRLGLITERFTVAHGVWLSDADMQCLANAGASVAVNPGSNMRLGSGLPDSRRMLAHGVNLAVGTDGSNSSDNQNMYEAIRMTAYVSRIFGPKIDTWLTARETLFAATVGGARSLGFEGEFGEIAVGQKADLVFLNLKSINWLPLNNAGNQLVHTEDGNAVCDVMVEGDYIVKNGKLVHLDIEDLGRRVAETRARLDEHSAENKKLFEELEPFVGRYCSGMACEKHGLHRYCGE